MSWPSTLTFAALGLYLIGTAAWRLITAGRGRRPLPARVTWLLVTLDAALLLALVAVVGPQL